jgi:hypothetical protein
MSDLDEICSDLRATRTALARVELMLLIEPAHSRQLVRREPAIEYIHYAQTTAADIETLVKIVRAAP